MRPRTAQLSLPCKKLSVCPRLPHIRYLNCHRHTDGCVMKTILIIEDHAEVREPLARLLQVEGYHVLAAAHGVEGLGLLDRHSADLILLDLMMPRMDGITLLQIVRSDPRWQDLPVIVLSGLAEGSLLNRARELNVSALMLKSKFKVDELFAQVRRCLAGRGEPIAV